MEPIFITIFHTNDMHARLEAMARLSSYARKLRHEATAQGRLVFFWDAGDAADRRSRLCSITKGAGFSSILNTMGYSLQTMGNAIALPYGPQAMADVARRAKFPVLAANCRDGTSPLPEGLKETTIIPLPRGLQMGVIGLTAPWGGLYEVFGLHFPDTDALTRELVKDLQNKKVALIILLSHLGLDEDRRLAETVPGIDLIIGGHTHDLLPEGEVVNGVLIAHAGEFAKAVGRIDLDLDPANGKVINLKSRVFNIPEIEEPDPAVLEAIAALENEVDERMSQPIGRLEEPLDLNHFQECDIGNLTADALRLRMKAEAALVSSGLFHEGLPKGTVTLGDLDTACFSSANPCSTSLRGSQILEALERGLDPAITQHMHHGFRGTPIGIPQVSGMTIQYNPDAETGDRVKKVFIQGEPLSLDRLYLIAHTDAETMQEYGYIQLEEGQRSKHEVPTIVREAIADYLLQYDTVPKPIRGRWQLIR
jgi:5'-nucleotidase